MINVLEGRRKREQVESSKSQRCASMSQRKRERRKEREESMFDEYVASLRANFKHFSSFFLFLGGSTTGEKKR